jgi:hypothetical protein
MSFRQLPDRAVRPRGPSAALIVIPASGVRSQGFQP